MDAYKVEYFDGNGNDQEYVVGLGGITSIKRYDYCPEQGCCKYLVQVFKNETLFCELHVYKAIYFQK